MKTTYLLTIITIIELIASRECGGSITLWILYGLYKLFKEEW